MALAKYVRSVSVDFEGHLDRKILRSDIANSVIAAGLDGFTDSAAPDGDTYVVDNDVFVVVFDATLSGDDENVLDAVIEAHRLAVAKKRKIAAIDARTVVIIGEGFPYEGKQFSLSQSAQANLIGVYSIRNDVAMTFPVDWNTVNDDDDVYSVVDIADFEAFYLAAFAALRVPLDAGTVLKTAVRDESDVAGVDAVVDAR
jgi:hypothetical protein